MNLKTPLDSRKLMAPEPVVTLVEPDVPRVSSIMVEFLPTPVDADNVTEAAVMAEAVCDSIYPVREVTETVPAGLLIALFKNTFLLAETLIVPASAPIKETATP